MLFPLLSPWLFGFLGMGAALLVEAQTRYYKEDLACDLAGVNLLPFTGHRVYKASIIKNDLVFEHSLEYVQCILGTVVQAGSLRVNRTDMSAYNRVFTAIKDPRQAVYPNGTLVLEPLTGLTRLKNTVIDVGDNLRRKHLNGHWVLNYKATSLRHYQYALQAMGNKTLAAKVYYSPENMEYLSFARFPAFAGRRYHYYVPYQTVGAQFKCAPTEAQLVALQDAFEFDKVGEPFDATFKCSPERSSVNLPLLAGDVYHYEYGLITPENPLRGGTGIQVAYRYRQPLVHTPHSLDPRFFRSGWETGIHVNEAYAYSEAQLSEFRRAENKLLNLVGTWISRLVLDKYIPFERQFWEALWGDAPWALLRQAVGTGITVVLPSPYEATFKRWLVWAQTLWEDFPGVFDIDTFVSFLLRKVSGAAGHAYVEELQRVALERVEPWW